MSQHFFGCQASGVHNRVWFIPDKGLEHQAVDQLPNTSKHLAAYIFPNDLLKNDSESPTPCTLMSMGPGAEHVPPEAFFPFEGTPVHLMCSEGTLSKSDKTEVFIPLV